MGGAGRAVRGRAVGTRGVEADICESAPTCEPDRTKAEERFSGHHGRDLSHSRGVPGGPGNGPAGPTGESSGARRRGASVALPGCVRAASREIVVQVKRLNIRWCWNGCERSVRPATCGAGEDEKSPTFRVDTGLNPWGRDGCRCTEAQATETVTTILSQFSCQIKGKPVLFLTSARMEKDSTDCYSDEPMGQGGCARARPAARPLRHPCTALGTREVFAVGPASIRLMKKWLRN